MFVAPAAIYLVFALFFLYLYVLDYLREHRTASSRELAAAAGLSLNGVRRTINELVEEGVIVRTPLRDSPAAAANSRLDAVLCSRR